MISCTKFKSQPSILSLNASGDRGGAGKAAMRLHLALIESGLDASMLVRRGIGVDRVRAVADSLVGGKLASLQPYMDRIPFLFYPERLKTHLSSGLMPNCLMRGPGIKNADILHLHWVGGGFVPVKGLGCYSGPIVWTLHDSWAFTGGCHVPGSCSAYRQTCGCCPLLRSSDPHDLTWKILDRKMRFWNNLDLTLVAPSHWMAGCARASTLFCNRRIEVIPNGIDPDLFSPCEKQEARDRFSLPNDINLILCGGVGFHSDQNKGWDLLHSALEMLPEERFRDRVGLVVVGERENAADLPLKVFHLGHLDDVDMRLAYSAADLFISPSRSENLSNMILESMACGTPVVAFSVGGSQEIIDHLATGFLAQPENVQSLSDGIAWGIESSASFDPSRCREPILTSYDIKKVAGQYRDLFRDLLY